MVYKFPKFLKLEIYSHDRFTKLVLQIYSIFSLYFLQKELYTSKILSNQNKKNQLDDYSKKDKK